MNFGEKCYTSSAGGNTGNVFSINEDTGELSSQQLDHEATSIYTLEITAADGGNPSRSSTCSVSVEVTDRNDNRPRFLETAYRAEISETAAVGSTVVTVSAVDDDAWQNQFISYSLTDGGNGLFKIDNITGTIRTAGLLDRERKAIYSLQVSVSSQGILKLIVFVHLDICRLIVPDL